MSGSLRKLFDALGDKSKLAKIPEVKPITTHVVGPSIEVVHSDDDGWLMRYEVDFDGVYPVEFLHYGLRQEPPRNIRNELERKAYSYYHERRSGAGDCDDE